MTFEQRIESFFREYVELKQKHKLRVDFWERIDDKENLGVKAIITDTETLRQLDCWIDGQEKKTDVS